MCWKALCDGRVHTCASRNGSGPTSTEALALHPSPQPALCATLAFPSAPWGTAPCTTTALATWASCVARQMELSVQEPVFLPFGQRLCTHSDRG
eukprot:scaffold133183_cov30-Tisochrysis_lutea.AAC.14